MKKAWGGRTMRSDGRVIANADDQKNRRLLEYHTTPSGIRMKRVPTLLNRDGGVCGWRWEFA